MDVEILYSLEPDHWGQGLAAEASRAVLDYAFGVVGVHRITAEIDMANTSSAEIALARDAAVAGRPLRPRRRRLLRRGPFSLDRIPSNCGRRSIESVATC